MLLRPRSPLNSAVTHSTSMTITNVLCTSQRTFTSPTLLRRMPILVDGNAFSHRWYHRWAHATKTYGPRGPTPESFIHNNAKALIALTQSISETDIVAGNTDMPKVPSYHFLPPASQRANQTIVFFDFGDGGRTLLYPDYKKERRERPRDQQLDLFFEEAKVVYRGDPSTSVIPELHHACVEALDAEADDMIATTSIFLRSKQIPHVIFSHDFDLMHLVSDTHHVALYDPRTKLIMNEDAVTKRVGIAPQYIVDYKSLCGDRSDGIPGIAGIGPKTAAKLLMKYGTLEQVLERGAKEESKSIQKKLAGAKSDADLSKSLVVHQDVGPVLLPVALPALGLTSLARTLDFDS